MSLRDGSATAARAAPAAQAARNPVLFLSTPTLPPLGADTWVHALAMRSLDQARFEVHCACMPGRPGAPTPAYQAFAAVPGVRLRAVNLGAELFGRSAPGKVKAVLGAIPSAASLLALAGYVRRNGIRLLHTTDRPRDALAAVLLARLTGARAVVHVHVAYGAWMSPGLRWAMARADALVGVSEFVARTLVEGGGYRRDRTHAVLNAIDLPAWNPDVDPGPARSALGIPPGAPVVTCVARLFPAKGQAELVRAVAELRRELPGVRLLVVGADYPPGTRFSEELATLARSLGVAENVILTGRRADVEQLLAASDVFAMPSFEEPFGLVYAEAMAMRRPVVALASGGAPEVVDDGRTGLLSPPGDVPALARNLLTLLRDPALRARMGAEGRRQVERRFTPARMGRDLGALYEALLARR